MSFLDHSQSCFPSLLPSSTLTVFYCYFFLVMYKFHENLLTTLFFPLLLQKLFYKHLKVFLTFQV